MRCLCALWVEGIISRGEVHKNRVRNNSLYSKESIAPAPDNAFIINKGCTLFQTES